MAYDRKKDFEEPLQKVLEGIKKNQDTVANQFEQLLQRSKVRGARKVAQVAPLAEPMSEETYQRYVAFLEKIEELIDLELL